MLLDFTLQYQQVWKFRIVGMIPSEVLKVCTASVMTKVFMRSHLLIPATTNTVLLETSLCQDGHLLWLWSLFNLALWSKRDSAVRIACSPSLDRVSDCRLRLIPLIVWVCNGLVEKFSAHIDRKHYSYIWKMLL